MSPSSKSLEVPSEDGANNEATSARPPIEQAIVHCPECGQECALSAIWCPHCGAPNTSAPAELVEDDVVSMSDRIVLYERLLEDLKRPAIEPLSNPQAPQVVQSFCEAQLRGLRSAMKRQALRDARHSLVARVKSAAHRPDFQAALELCQRPSRLPADDPVVQELRRQLEERLLTERQAARVAAEVLALQRAAQSCLQEGQLAEAEAKLKAALERQPGDAQTLEMLRKVEQKFVDQMVSAEASASGPSADHADAVQAEAAPLSSAAHEAASPQVETAANPATAKPANVEPVIGEVAPVRTTPLVTPATAAQPPAAPSHSFAEAEEVPSPTQRHIEAFSQWTSLIKPFLLDNVGWFVGAFLVVAGFIVLIVTFWNTIEQNQILLHSLVYASTLVTTGLFFALAYFMRLRYPRLENSSDTLLVIVALLIPLVFAAAVLTALIPASLPAEATGYLEQVRAL